ncbi:MAG: hypothetical protein K6E54_01150 [Bacteroidaceae bacterium]|nr:hypothetical protein [Bacteroidaceae bacterium]
MKYIVISSVFIALLLCSCNKSNSSNNEVSQVEVQDSVTNKSDERGTESSELNATEDVSLNDSSVVSKIDGNMAYEGVNNYCHKEYDWSVAEENPSMMYVKMGEETDSTYQVIFRSYTGAFVYFYVNKESGSTRMVEHVPAVNITSEAGTINLLEYLEKKD